MSEEQSLIEFPCDFTIKIIGQNTAEFKKDINKMIIKHYPKTTKGKITYKESKDGKYLSISATVYAKNQNELDKLYMELTSHPQIRMVL